MSKHLYRVFLTSVFIAGRRKLLHLLPQSYPKSTFQPNWSIVNIECSVSSLIALHLCMQNNLSTPLSAVSSAYDTLHPPETCGQIPAHTSRRSLAPSLSGWVICPFTSVPGEPVQEELKRPLNLFTALKYCAEVSTHFLFFFLLKVLSWMTGPVSDPLSYLQQYKSKEAAWRKLSRLWGLVLALLWANCSLSMAWLLRYNSVHFTAL